MRRICERQNLRAQCATDVKHLDFGVTISQIRNARELVHLRKFAVLRQKVRKSSAFINVPDFVENSKSPCGSYKTLTGAHI